MTIGQRIVALAANDQPFAIKELVTERLEDNAAQIFTEGYKIVAEQKYGGIFEGRRTTGQKTISKFNHIDRQKGMKSWKPGKTDSYQDKHKIRSSVKRGQAEKAPWFKKQPKD